MPDKSAQFVSPVKAFWQPPKSDVSFCNACTPYIAIDPIFAELTCRICGHQAYKEKCIKKHIQEKHEKPTHTCGKPEKSDQDGIENLQESNNNDSKSGVATEEPIDYTNGFHGFESNASSAFDEVQETIDPLHDRDLTQLKGSRKRLSLWPYSLPDKEPRKPLSIWPSSVIKPLLSKKKQKSPQRFEIPDKPEKSNQETIKILQNSIENLQDSIKNLQESIKNDSKSDVETCFIDIHNVFCSFKVRCPLDLEDISKRGHNVELCKKNRNYIIIKLKQPLPATAKIWPSGKILCMGTKSEEDSKIAARRIARLLQNLGYKVIFSNFTIHNCHGSVLLPFHIKIVDFCKAHQEASYEPELHSGVIYKVEDLGATITIHQTGQMIIFAPSVKKLKGSSGICLSFGRTICCWN